MDLVHRNAAVPTGLDELETQPALAHSRLADDADDLPARVEGARKNPLQPGEIGVTADQPGEALAARGIEPRARRSEPLELEDPDRGTHSLHRPRPEVGEREEALDQP